ncbi:MAG: nuclear transport factor 2 family protein [Rhizomicrobium sp.]
MSGAQRAVEDYIAAWNEPDAAGIAGRLQACMAEDAVLTASYQTVSGRSNLVQLIAEFRRSRPGDRAVLTSEVETVGSRFRFTGGGRHADGTLYGEVMDVGELDGEGRIKWLTTFDTAAPRKP